MYAAWIWISRHVEKSTLIHRIVYTIYYQRLVNMFDFIYICVLYIYIYIYIILV